MQRPNPLWVEVIDDFAGSDIHRFNFLDIFIGKRKIKYIKILLHSILLYANGVFMKHMQGRLGHSDFGTTASTYTHLEYASKAQTAQAIAGIVKETKKDE